MNLVVGIMLILLSIVHVVYGEKEQVSLLKKMDRNNILIGSFRVMSLQGGLLLFAVGVVEILVFAGSIALTGFAVFIPLGLVCLNLMAFLIVALVKNQELIKNAIPQLIIFAIIITFQIISVA